jgi:hypothetical protein
VPSIAEHRVAQLGPRLGIIGYLNITSTGAMTFNASRVMTARYPIREVLRTRHPLYFGKKSTIQ